LPASSSRRPWSRRAKRVTATCLAAALLLGIWAFLVEPRRLVVNHTDLELPRWPPGAPPLRVALLSDLHVGSPHWSASRIRALVERSNAEKPDIVLLAGDYMIDRVLGGTKVGHEEIADALSGLHAPGGVVAVLGNHDWWNDGLRMRRALESRGIVVLENETHTFAHRGMHYAIAGLADAITRHPEPAETFAQSPTDVPIIALTHEPDLFPSIDDRPAITLAGHTHGGQVRLPLLGRLIVPSAFGQRYAAGHVVEGGRHLFVTTGVGTSILPVRFAVPPEIAILTLRSAG
jgi:predicted MPP superfamily phosphohydrolase